MAMDQGAEGKTILETKGERADKERYMTFTAEGQQ